MSNPRDIDIEMYARRVARKAKQRYASLTPGQREAFLKCLFAALPNRHSEFAVKLVNDSLKWAENQKVIVVDKACKIEENTIVL